MRLPYSGLGTVLMPAGHYRDWDPFDGKKLVEPWIPAKNMRE